MFEYGSRAGFWRLWRMFTESSMLATVFGVATALQRNPDVVAAMKEAGWDIASHSLKWHEHKDMSGAEERGEIAEATRELLRRNGLRDCYIRPIAFRGYGEMGLYAKSAPVEVVIAAWPWGAYLGEDGKKHGIRAKVSSWRRISAQSSIPHAKASGQYLNSILAKTESANAGYEEAILLDERGFVCEGSGENIFVVKDGKVITPPHVAAILDGINRKSVIQILADSGHEVEIRDLARSELYVADEVFMCGTAAEVVPVREIDDHPLGEPGEITRLVQDKFNDAIYGRSPQYSDWLDLVDVPEVPATEQQPSTVSG